ncbi:DNA repair protein RecO [Limnobacter humi]|uniref:DNA repair protein RecO n=1 Tax=Limnobacter humi TaxID=1778671 RepID=A0ABT1WEI9_9BURK|nr:DNA repair protein RecO [Limnobacter humi]MCQ8895936.1 DNA repair protein RecO [Limnobacter humi]
MNRNIALSDTAFVLHAVPYKETSLIVELFCRESGRLPVVAKGAKRPHSGLRAVLVSFQPIHVRFSGRSEVKTLMAAEWAGGLLAPTDKALFSAYYLNELLMQGLGREDAHPALFDSYAQALAALAVGEDMTQVVRRFEIELLQALGYGLTLDHDADGQPIRPDALYVWLNEVGWSHSDGLGVLPGDDAIVEHGVPGQVILDLQSGVLTRAAASVLKMVTRKMLAAHVAPNGVVSRSWMEQLIKA